MHIILLSQRSRAERYGGTEALVFLLSGAPSALNPSGSHFNTTEAGLAKKKRRGRKKQSVFGKRVTSGVLAFDSTPMEAHESGDCCG